MDRLNDTFKDVKGVLFDLDGTLVNTLPGLTQLVNYVRRDFDKPPLSEAKVSTYIGKGMPNLIHRSLTEDLNGRLPENVYRMAIHSLSTHVEKGNYDKGTLYPGVLEALDELRARGFKIALVTNKPYQMTLDTTIEKGLPQRVDAVIGGDTAEKPKPNPDPVLLACEKLGVLPSEAVMVGDSGNDSESALRAGVKCILVTTGWSEGISLEEIAKRDKVVVILNGIREVVSLLIRSKTNLAE